MFKKILIANRGDQPEGRSDAVKAPEARSAWRFNRGFHVQ
jgi:hypothetical protein